MVLRAITDFFGLHESELQDQSVGGIALAFLFLPFRIVWGFIIFMISAWSTSRDGRSFLLGIPAMLAFVLYVAVAWLVGQKGEGRAFSLSRLVYARYSVPNDPAYDPHAALMFATKMVELRDFDESLKYELALSHARLEQFDLAYDVIRMISPDVDDIVSISDAGHAPGYVWLARYYANPSLSGLAEEQAKSLIRKNLELAHKIDATNVAAVLGLAVNYRENATSLTEEAERLQADGDVVQADEKKRLAQQNNRDAIKFFNLAIDLPLSEERQLYASPAVIEILQDLGRHDEALLTGRRFINKYENSAVRLPNTLPFWVSLVRTCILIKDFDKADSLIQQGYQLATVPEIRRILAQQAALLQVERSKFFDDMDDEKTFLKRLAALSNAIVTEVLVPEAYQQLLFYVDGFDQNDEKDAWLRSSIVSETFRQSSMDSRTSGIVHLVLGMRDTIQKNKENGRRHWETSGQHFKFSPFAINFLIQVYVDGRNLDSSAKNELISLAIEIFPQAPHFYTTRGRYFLEDKQYAKAVEDLEFASARLPESLPLLENLLKCYEAMEDSENVEKYQLKIAKMQARQLASEQQTGLLIPAEQQPD